MVTFAKKVILTAALVVGTVMISNAQVVYFNGLGRALVTGSSLNGNLLNKNTAAGQPKDTSSYRKSTDGYTIFDLGINSQPNESLRASVILRLQNAFGGFYGDGSQFLFRQLRLDGVISKKVKYEIGDIDLSLTHYTLHNFSEVYNDHESDVVAQRRSVVEYENFNFGNNWRLQGAHIQTNLRFKSGIEKIGVRMFATRNRRYVPATTPDRFMVGGRVDLVQSRIFQIGGNYVYSYDAAGSVTNILGVTNYNQVLTGDFKLNHYMDNFDLSLYGEAGTSSNGYKINNESRDTVGNSSLKFNGQNSFYDVGASVKFKPALLKLWVNYRNVGEDFFSSGAQTRRMNDYGSAGLFTNIDNNTSGGTRTAMPMGGATLMDFVSDPTLRNLNLKSSLMQFNPVMNNITPYGQATPNRKGFTIGASIGSNEKVLKADVQADIFSERVSVGDSVSQALRKYVGLKGGFTFNVHKLLRYEKLIILTFGDRLEHTTRSGTDKIDLKSNLIDLGLTVEVVKQLDLIGGLKMINATGNEYLINNNRNQFNQITYFTGSNSAALNGSMNLGQTQMMYMYGARYRFSKNTYFTINGVSQYVTFANKAYRNYNIQQIFFNYTMIF
jgi:hypothetical protein